MTTYYVGSGGNDGNAGTSWAQRKLTLNGAENVPVAAGDTVYVGAGVYRETLTVDVSGGAGNTIDYIADVSGENTDGIGGIVRVTGSDNDQTEARTYGISANTKNYRVFQGFYFDLCSTAIISMTDCTNWTIQDCVFGMCTGYQTEMLGASQASITIQRCVYYTASGAAAILLNHAATVDNVGHVIRNCYIRSHAGFVGVLTQRVGGFTVSHCDFIGIYRALRVQVALSVGQTITVNNSLFQGCAFAFVATAVGEITENYNSLFGNGTDRTNTNVGANSVAYPWLRNPPMLLDGYVYPVGVAELSQWSPVRAITGTSMASDDMLGRTRPATDSKKSWGAVQYMGEARDASTTYSSSAASLTLPDAGRVQFRVPTANSTQITVSCYVYREANYAGTNPRLIVKQPGQSDDVTTDAAAASQWNQLTTTLTPANSPDYVIVELASLNTAGAGNYAVYFDALNVDSSPDIADLDNWLTDRIPFSEFQADGGAGGGLLRHPGMTGGFEA